MVNFIEEKIRSLTDEQLKECWKNIQSYRKEGVMGDTLVRQIKDELAKKIGDDRWDIGCTIVTIPEILHEIARRHFKE